jgi:hypothetical protein
MTPFPFFTLFPQGTPLSSRIWLAVVLAGWGLALAGIAYATLFVSGEIIRKDNIIYTPQGLLKLLSFAVGFILCGIGSFGAGTFLLFRRNDKILMASTVLGVLYIGSAIVWHFGKQLFSI